MPPCRLCAHPEPALVARQRVLHKYQVAYAQCPRCDLLQTEPPYWLGESYDDSVAILDTGAIDRNLLCADLVTVLAALLKVGPGGTCLDFGAGNGVFVRLMRDRGLDFRWADKFATNLYARGFEGNAGAPHDLVTAFEVFEHFDDVAGELERLFRPGHRFVLASTFLHRGHRDGWWYYVPEVGQHVAFYSRRTMAYIGERFGYAAICGPAFTLFVNTRAADDLGWRGGLIRRILNRHRYRQAQSPWVRWLLRVIPRHPSLVEADQQTLRTAPPAGTKSPEPSFAVGNS
jgi:hypothetical protein